MTSFQTISANPVDSVSGESGFAAREIQWGDLSNLSFLRHGSGTSIFLAILDGVSVILKAPRTALSDEEYRTVTEELRHEV